MGDMYEKYNDKEIKLTHSDGEVENATVYHVDPAIGITMHSFDPYDGKQFEFFCLNGPSSPHWDRYVKYYPQHETMYEAMFDYVVKGIDAGNFSVPGMLALAGIQNSEGGIVSCAFTG